MSAVAHRKLLTVFCGMTVVLLGSGIMNPYPQNYFRSPIGIPIKLAGSFGEMRTNHFHSGLDIKTNNRTGYKIYAAADGWISRVSISQAGFGNALYISHPNGYTTVYGHLDHFSKDIAAFAKKYQYDRESFRINALPAKGRFRVKQGDVIAFSGNSGSSSGPHLHFEIRDSNSYWPINPALFGLGISDTRAPRVYRLRIYGKAPNSFIRLHDKISGGWRTLRGESALSLGVTRRGDLHVLSRIDRIQASGPIGFGIQTNDFQNGSTNRLGAYRIELSSNGRPLFKSEVERFSFGRTRDINAHVDYAERVRTGRWFQQSFVLPGNELPFYESTNEGILEALGGSSYNLVYRIVDVAENESVLPLTVEGISPPPSAQKMAQGPTSNEPTVSTIHFGTARTLSISGASVSVPADAFYADVDFDFDPSTIRSRKSFSHIFQVGRSSIAVKKAISLSIEASGLPSRYFRQALLARVSRKGKLTAAGGSYKNGYVRGNISVLGTYAIAVDSVGPRIRPLNISQGKSMRSRNSIRLRVSDNFSGLKTFRGEIDGNWVLFEYDAKSARLTHTFDGRLGSGHHRLTVRATDRVQNETVYTVDFRK